MAHKIFISYSHKDDAFALKLATQLSQAGAYIWMDVRNIPAGMNWSSEIQKGLEQSELMIVILSPDSMQSQQVEKEWLYFLNRHKPVIPVLHRPTQVHYQLEPLQYVDFVKNSFDTAFDKLLDELKTNGFRVMGFGAPTTGSSGTPPKAREINWTKWGVISAVIVGLLAVIATLAQPLIADMLNGNSPTPTVLVTEETTELAVMPTETELPPTPTPEPAEESSPESTAITGDGAANFRLMWDRNSLVLLINGRTHLGSLALNTVNRDERESSQSVAQLFPVFSVQDFVVDTPGICLNVYRSGQSPVLPLACSGEVFRLEMADFEVFWYDNTGNALRTIIVRHGEDSTICSAATQPCNVES
jgi:hypothetical protein